MSGLVIHGHGGGRPPRIVHKRARGDIKRVLDAVRPSLERRQRSDRAAWVNPHSGLGGIHDRASFTEFEGGSPMSSQAADALMEFNAIARRVVWREPEDATREGYDLKGQYTPEQLEAIEAASTSKETNLLNIVTRGRAFARATGGAGAIIFAEDGWKMSDPLDFTRLEKINRIEVVDAFDLCPVQWGTNRKRKRTWGKPVLYQYHLHSAGPVSTSGLVHHSRVVRFDGLELPARQQALRLGWGGAILDLIYTELANALGSHQFTAEAVSMVTNEIYKITGIGEAGLAGNSDYIVDRLEAIQLSRGIFGGVVIDKDEEYQVIERSFTGLGDLLDRLTAMLVAVSEQSKTILMGEQPSGLNANGDSEIQAWYDHCASRHDPDYTPPLMELLQVLLRARLGPTGGYWDPKTSVDWRPLWTPTEDESASTNLKHSQATALMVSSGVVSTDEARKQPWLSEAFVGFDPNAPAPPPPAAPPGAPGGDAFDAVESTEPIIAADDSEMMPGEPLVGTRDVARFLGVSRATVINMARDQRFPAFRMNRAWRFQMSSVRAGVARYQAEATDGARGDQAPLC